MVFNGGFNEVNPQTIKSVYRRVKNQHFLARLFYWRETLLEGNCSEESICFSNNSGSHMYGRCPGS
jgi:hypothetical protein